MTASFPATASERNAWVLSLRPPRHEVDATKPYAFLLERERTSSGTIASTATVFLTNRECPWRCVMCDLWKNTLTQTVPPGAIPSQIQFALEQLSTARGATQIKLYNSGSFFDPGAVPPADYAAIAEQLLPFERVIVECHPSLVKESILRFRGLIRGKLEVAMGLETVHPEVLEKLNKRMTLEAFSAAAAFLKANGIDMRAFILVKPPFMNEADGLHWAKRSIDFAFDHGAGVASLIPTRFGNGALEALAKQGAFAQPKVSSLEAALDHGLALKRGRVFADVWDLAGFSECLKCFPARQKRLEKANLEQALLPRVACHQCGEG